MSIVWPWQEAVSKYVEAGKSVVAPLPACPGCGRRLGRWSGYWRWLRCPGADAQIWIWRTRCTACRVSHALLPDFLFHRRLDEVAVIGPVLERLAVHKAAVRVLARRFDLPRATVRAWWGRFRTRSPTVLTELLDVAIRLNPTPVDLLTDGEAAVFEALDQAVMRARVRFGERVGDAWRFWSRLSGGRVLTTNTSASWRDRADRSWMAASH
jgi:hypothetical protein